MDNKTYQNSWFKYLLMKESELNNIGFDIEVLELYRNMVHGHLSNALIKMFPRFSEYYNPDWDSLIKDYYILFPPESYELNELAYSLPDFLHIKKYPNELIELVKYEILEFVVYKKLNQVNYENSLNTTLEVHRFEYDIAGFVTKCDDFEVEEKSIKQLEIAKESNILAICRNFETNLCLFTKLDMLSVGVIEILKQVEISKNNFEEEIQMGLCELLAKNIEKSNIQKTLDFLRNQKIINY